MRRRPTVARNVPRGFCKKNVNDMTWHTVFEFCLGRCLFLLLLGLLCFRDELHRHAVHAVAQPGRLGPVGEDVAEVPVAVRTSHLSLMPESKKYEGREGTKIRTQTTKRVFTDNTSARSLCCSRWLICRFLLLLLKSILSNPCEHPSAFEQGWIITDPRFSPLGRGHPRERSSGSPRTWERRKTA